jgi:hypothetical protein
MPTSWTEIGGGPNNWTLAGRRALPPESPGAAVGAAVKFISNSISEASLNLRIRQELPGLDTEVRRLLSGSRPRYGVLAVVSHEVIHHPFGLQGYNFRAVALHQMAYANPQAAMQTLAPMAARYGTISAAGATPAVSPQRRYFWGEYVALPEPTSAERYGTIRAEPPASPRPEPTSAERYGTIRAEPPASPRPQPTSAERYGTIRAEPPASRR